MSAEERELMEEVQAIKAAQKTAKEIFGFNTEKRIPVNKAKGKAMAGSKSASGCVEQSKAPEGSIARWLARAAVQGCAA